jgi:hypothetical protein
MTEFEGLFSWCRRLKHLAMDSNSFAFCLCAREISKIPTIPSEIRPTTNAICCVLRAVSKANA